MGDVGGPYSPLKIIHHRERLDQLRRGEQIVPTQIQLILSDLCQHDCSFCHHRLSGHTTNELFTAGAELAKFGTNNPRRILPLAKALEILDDCAEMGVKAIQFTGGGEPTVHPQHREIFQATIARGLKLALVSNGAIFRGESAGLPSTVDLLLQAAWVRFSIDAATPETYAAIRRIPPTVFPHVLANVRSLVDAKQAAGAGPIIGLGFVVTRENWREVVMAAELARSIGVDNLRISAVFQPDDAAYFDDFHADAAALCREAASLATPAFQVFNRFSDRLENLRDKHPDYQICGYQQFNTFIGADQNVYRCCNLSYSTRGLIGSLKNQRFRTLWESESKQLAMEGFDARGCPRCMFSSINRTIAYAVDPAPQHVDFV